MTQRTKKNIISLKAQYNKLTGNKIATNLMWLKQFYYDQGEKVWLKICMKVHSWPSSSWLQNIIFQKKTLF